MSDDVKVGHRYCWSFLPNEMREVVKIEGGTITWRKLNGGALYYHYSLKGLTNQLKKGVVWRVLSPIESLLEVIDDAS